MAFDPNTAQELDLTPDVLRTLGPTPQPEQDTPPAPAAFDSASAVEIDLPDEVILHEQSGKNVQVPPTLNGNEADFMVKKNVEKADPSRFWGIVDLGMQVMNPSKAIADAAAPYAVETGRGFANAAVTAVPKMIGGNMEEFGERRAVDGYVRGKLGMLQKMLPNVYTPEYVDTLASVGGMLDAPTYDKLAVAGKNLTTGVETWANEHGLARPPESEGNAKQFFFDIGSGINSIGLAIGMTYLTRNPAAASVLFGNMAKSSSYVEARDKGLSPDTAGDYSTIQGITNGAIEMVGNGLFMKMAELSTPLRRIAMRAVEEGSQEALQQGAEEVIANVADVRDTTLQEGLKNVAYAALVGAVAGAPIATAVELAERNNVPVDKAQKVMDSIAAQQPEAVQAASELLNMGTNGLAKDAKLEAESAEIVRKFQTGEPIDLTSDMTVPPAQINAAPLEKRLAKRLEEVGLDKEQATKNATLVRAAYETLSNRYGASIQPAIDAEFNKLEIGDSNVLDQGALTQQTKAVTQTPEFQNWFGDSKVVDGAGNPLVVYHGTRGDFEKFQQGSSAYFFTADTGLSNIFSENRKGGNVIPVYLSAKNPASEEIFGQTMDSVERDYENGQVQKRGEGSYDSILAESVERMKMAGYDSAQDATGAWIVFDPTQIKSVFNRGTFDPADPRILYQFAGTASQTANHNALENAQQRIQSGEDPEMVRQETGWAKGIDGQWRYEISDDQAVVREMHPEPGQSIRIKLGKLLEHPKLFAAYPDLANINVVWKTNLRGETRGAYTDTKNGRIELEAKSSGSAISTLLHEIQHAIQDKEGFARGSNTDISIRDLRRQQGGLPNASVVAQARDLTQLAEGMEGTIDEAVKATKNRATTGPSEWQTAAIYLAKNPSELEAAENVLRIGANAEEAYRANAGEIEARNTSARYRMDENSRKLNAPQITEDFDRRNAVVVFSDGTTAQAPRTLFQGNEPARPRGVRGSISLRPNQALVRLFDGADASTFLHETGHFYWETLNALSQQKNAPKALRDDVQVLRDWVGAVGNEPFTVDQHEQMARGVEAYLMEGRAPSLRLADIFEKFRQWLRDIYKTVKALRADVSPEVQAVLDRLFATDEEMQQVRTAAVAEEALGRLRWLDRQIGALDVQMDDLDRLIQEREAAGKPNVANARSMQRLQNQRDAYDQERADLLTNEGSRQAFEFANSPIEIKAGRLKRLAEEALDAKRRALEQGLREGRAMARQDVAAAQRIVVDTIQDSGLTATDKAKFLNTLKTLQTSDQLEKMLPRIQARIGTLLEREAQRQAKNKLVTLLKKTKPTKQGGKPKGRFTPEIQDMLDRLRELATLKAGEAQARLDARLASYANDEPPSPTDALENQVLAVMADRDAVPSGEIQDTVASVTDLLREGKLAAAERMAARAERLADLKMMARMALESQGDRKLVDRTAWLEQVRAKGREIRGGAYMVQQDWHGLLNLVFGKDRTSGDELIDQLGQGISEGFQNRKGIVRRATEDMTERMKKAFGFTQTREALRQMKADEKLLDIGTFVNAAGEEVRLQMTKSQARKRWMEMQDPTLVETITDPNGNAYTPAMMEAVEDILTPQDKAFANAQLDFYRDFYRQVNEVYSEVYGLNLPHNPFYSPISRRHSKEDATDTFHGEQNFRRSASAGSLKSRVKTNSALRDLSDMETLQRHIAQMAHFISFQQKLQEVNVVLSDQKVRDEIKDRFGTNVLTALDETRNDFGRGQIRYIKEGLDSFESLRQRFSTAMLGLKPALAVKNMTQFVVYGETIPTTDFIAGVADFLKNPVKAAKILNESEMLKARGTDLNRDVALALKSGEFGRFAENPRMTNAMLWFTQAGDKAAVMMGGWAVYRHAIKQGKTHEQALKAFEKATSESQQTSDLDRMSRLELSSNVLGRTLTMFMSGQNRAYRREVKAGLDFARGKISAGEAAKIIALYHFVLPMFYQFVADFFTWDDENQQRAALWGSLNGLFIVWDVLDALGRRMMGEPSFEKTMPTFEFFYKLLDAMTNLGNALETDDPDDWYKAIKEGVTGAGMAAGLPLSRGFDVYEGLESFDEAPLSGAARILGWPKSVGNALAEEENAGF